MSPRPRIPQRRERLLEAAERLLLERGFDAMSMQSLADDVGIAKGAIYREFASKDELVDELLMAANARVLAAAGAGIEGSDEPPALSSGYRAWALALLDEPLLCAAFLDDSGVLGERVARGRDGRYRARHDGVRAWVRRLQATGRLRPDVDPDGLSLALSSATLGLLSAARTLGPLTRDELVSALGALADLTRAIELPAPGPGSSADGFGADRPAVAQWDVAAGSRPVPGDPAQPTQGDTP